MPSSRLDLQRGAEQDDDDRGVADDPAHPEGDAGADAAPRGRQQHAADRRDPVLAERVGGLADVARDRLQRLARRADDQRQRDQRHDRAGDEEGAAEDGVALAVKERKPKKLCWKTSRPKIASTMLGVPATISTPDSTARASQEGRPYSVSQTAIPTPTGAAIAVPITVRTSVPSIGSRKPPLLLWSRPTSGWLKSRSRAQVLDAADEHVEDDRGGDQAEQDPRRPGSGDADLVAEAPGARRPARRWRAEPRRRRSSGLGVRAHRYRAAGCICASSGGRPSRRRRGRRWRRAARAANA